MSRACLLLIFVSLPLCLSGCGGCSNDSADQKEVDPQSLVPADPIFVVVAHPSQHIGQIQDIPLDDLLEVFSLHPDAPHRAIWLRMFGKRLGDIEQLIYVMTELPGKDSQGKSRGIRRAEDGFILRFKQPVESSVVQKSVFRGTKLSHEDKSYWGRSESPWSLAVFQADPKTLVVGALPFVKRSITALAKDKPADATTWNLDAQENQLAAALDVAKLSALDSGLSTNKSWLDDVTHAQVKLQLSKDLNWKLEISARDGDAAGRIEQALPKLLAGLSGNRLFENINRNAEKRKVASTTLKHLTRIMTAAKVQRNGSKLTASYSDPDGLKPTARYLEELYQQAKASADFDKWVNSTRSLENRDAELIRQAIPAAAGMKLETLARFATSNSTPSLEDFTEQPVSFSLLVERIANLDETSMQAMYPQRFSELRFTNLTVNPADLFTTMMRSSWLGYATVINPSQITDFRCEIDGDTASGEVAFESVDLYKGEFAFVAKRKGEAWQITRFSLPGRGWEFERQANGSWKGTDRFGSLADQKRYPKRHPVTGSLEIAGQRLPKERLRLFHRKDPTLGPNSVLTDENGEFALSMPPGEYYVSLYDRALLPGRTAKPDAPKIPEVYLEPRTSPLRIEIKSGANEFQLQLME